MCGRSRITDAAVLDTQRLRKSGAGKVGTQTATEPRATGMPRFWQFATLGALVVAAVGIGGMYLERQKVAQEGADIRQQSSVIQAQATDLQRQSAAIQAEAKPDLPLSYGFRRAILGTGNVMLLRNNSATPLDLAVIVTSAATGLVQRREVDVPADRTIQLGPVQGWTFVPGQHVAFRNVNFRPAEILVR